MREENDIQKIAPKVVNYDRKRSRSVRKENNLFPRSKKHFFLNNAEYSQIISVRYIIKAIPHNVK